MGRDGRHGRGAPGRGGPPPRRSRARVGRCWLHGREALGGSGPHVELRAVEGAFDPVALQPAFAEVRERVRTDVLEGVKFPFHVAQGDPPSLDLVLLHLARRDLVRRRKLVELLGHYAARSPKPSPILPSMARSSFSLRPLRGTRLVTSPKNPNTTSFSASCRGMPRLIR